MGMKLPLFLGFSAICAGVLVSCAGSPPPPTGSGSAPSAAYSQTPDGYYRVKRGDSLHAIAFKFSLDWREIARLNGISAPYTIFPDQMLQLVANPLASPGATSTEQGGVRIAAAPPPSETATRPLDTPDSSDTTVDSAEPRAVDRPLEAEPQPGNGSETAPGDGEQTELKSEKQDASGVPPVSGQPDSHRQAASQASQSPPPVADPPTAQLPPPQMTVPTTPAGDPAQWMWPTEGRLLSSFRSDDAARKGIDIGGRKGQPVVASAPGTVVYSGSGLIGYGELIIIKHSDRMLSAYAHNSKRLVSEGQQVGAGTQIAEMGINDRNQALLHFEIRVNGSPQDPQKYLPRR